MHTTQPLTTSTAAPADFGVQLAETLALIGTVFVAGPPVLVAWAGTVLLALMLAGPFVLLVTLVAALVATTALIALAAAILAAPYLVVRHVAAHWLRHTSAATTKAPPAAVTMARASTSFATRMRSGASIAAHHRVRFGRDRVRLAARRARA